MNITLHSTLMEDHHAIMPNNAFDLEYDTQKITELLRVLATHAQQLHNAKEMIECISVFTKKIIHKLKENNENIIYILPLINDIKKIITHYNNINTTEHDYTINLALSRAFKVKNQQDMNNTHRALSIAISSLQYNDLRITHSHIIYGLSLIKKKYNLIQELVNANVLSFLSSHIIQKIKSDPEIKTKIVNMFYHSIMVNSEDTLKTLIDKDYIDINAPLDKDCSTALKLTFINENYDLFFLLLSYNPSLFNLDKNELSVYDLLSIKNTQSTHINRLIDNIDKIPFDFDYFNPIHNDRLLSLIKNKNHDNLIFVYILQQYKQYIENDTVNLLALYQALPSLQVIMLLLKHLEKTNQHININFNEANNEGYKLLELLAYANQTHFICYLLDNHVINKKNIISDIQDILSIAVNNNNYQLCLYLLNHREQLKITNEQIIFVYNTFYTQGISTALYELLLRACHYEYITKRKPLKKINTAYFLNINLFIQHLLLHQNYINPEKINIGIVIFNIFDQIDINQLDIKTFTLLLSFSIQKKDLIMFKILSEHPYLTTIMETTDDTVLMKTTDDTILMETIDDSVLMEDEAPKPQMISNIEIKYKIFTLIMQQEHLTLLKKMIHYLYQRDIPVNQSILTQIICHHNPRFLLLLLEQFPDIIQYEINTVSYFTYIVFNNEDNTSEKLLISLSTVYQNNLSIHYLTNSIIPLYHTICEQMQKNNKKPTVLLDRAYFIYLFLNKMLEKKILTSKKIDYYQKIKKLVSKYCHHQIKDNQMKKLFNQYIKC